MSRRKHVMLGLRDEIEPPTENQQVVQVVGTRGGNIVEVSYPDGRQTLCLLPSKFNKKLWVKRGGYLLVQDGPAGTPVTQAMADDPAAATTTTATTTPAPSSSSSPAQPSTSAPGREGKITGTIVAVLYDEHIRQLKKIPGVWPAEYTTGKEATAQGDTGSAQGLEDEASDQQQQQQGDGGGGGEVDEEGYESEDSGLPALERNTNRKVIYHDDDSDSDSG